MPTYEYACTACDHRFEAVQSFTDPTLTDCPACEGKVRKLFSAVGIVFRGPGFYRTDSRAGSGKAGNGDGVDGGRGGERKPDKGSEKADKGSEKPSSSGEKSGKPSASDKPAPSTSAPSKSAGAAAAAAS